MNGHLSAELLSAYVDGEATGREALHTAAHLSSCAACRQRLAGMRRVVGGLQQMTPAAAPAALAERLRRQLDLDRAVAAAAASPRGPLVPWRAALRRWLALPRAPLEPVTRHILSASLAGAMALLVMIGFAEHGTLPGLRLGASPSPTSPAFLVSEDFGETPAVLQQTTSEVAGRVFVLSDDVWVQRGVDASARQPRERVQARSPQGRALLAQMSDLGVLLADGSRVVLRYKLETLELVDGS